MLKRTMIRLRHTIFFPSPLMGRLSLLHTVVQFGCNLGANILQQHGNNGHYGPTNPHIWRMKGLLTTIYRHWT
jgi:hypothetical protein